jgi:hypothetical protein
VGSSAVVLHGVREMFDKRRVSNIIGDSTFKTLGCLLVLLLLPSTAIMIHTMNHFFGDQ